MTIGDDTASGSGKDVAKERPVWLLESTVINTETSQVRFFFHLVYENFIIFYSTYCCSTDRQSQLLTY